MGLIFRFQPWLAPFSLLQISTEGFTVLLMGESERCVYIYSEQNCSLSFPNSHVEPSPIAAVPGAPYVSRRNSRASSDLQGLPGRRKGGMERVNEGWSDKDKITRRMEGERTGMNTRHPLSIPRCCCVQVQGWVGRLYLHILAWWGPSAARTTEGKISWLFWFSHWLKEGLWGVWFQPFISWPDSVKWLCSLGVFSSIHEVMVITYTSFERKKMCAVLWAQWQLQLWG